MREPARLEALIFDVDGTLADTEEMHRRAFNAAFHAYGLDWHWTVELYADLLRITGGKERIAHYLGRLRLAPAERARLEAAVPAIHRSKTRLFTDLVAGGGVPARPGVARLMREAREAGVRLAIASTTSPENVEALMVSSLGREAPAWFATIATGDVVAAKKPAPDIYLLALRTLEVGASQAIAFEDSELGVRAARAAGLFTVATPSEWTKTQDFSGAQIVLPSLEAQRLGDLAVRHAAAH